MDKPVYTTPQLIDYLIVVVYFVFVLGVGFKLKKNMKTAEDFLLAGHHSGKGAQGIPSWVTGLAFCRLILVPLRSWVWPPMLLNTAL